MVRLWLLHHHLLSLIMVTMVMSKLHCLLITIANYQKDIILVITIIIIIIIFIIIVIGSLGPPWHRPVLSISRKKVTAAVAERYHGVMT